MPLDPPPINRLPAGLLDLLGVRSGGRYPQHLTEQLIPTMDLGDWYRDSNVTNFGFSTAPINASANSGRISIISTGLPQPIPQNEAWILRTGSHCSWTFSAGAGTSWFGQLGVVSAAGQRYLIPPVSYNGYSQSDAAVLRGGAAVTLSDMWMHPGDTIQVLSQGAVVGGAPAPAISIFGTLSIVRLRI